MVWKTLPGWIQKKRWDNGFTKTRHRRQCTEDVGFVLQRRIGGIVWGGSFFFCSCFLLFSHCHVFFNRPFFRYCWLVFVFRGFLWFFPNRNGAFPYLFSLPFTSGDSVTQSLFILALYFFSLSSIFLFSGLFLRWTLVIAGAVQFSCRDSRAGVYSILLFSSSFVLYYLLLSFMYRGRFCGEVIMWCEDSFSLKGKGSVRGSDPI
jgi:hypothetical protein